MHGNYLKASIVAAGLDPDNLPASDVSKMNFGTGRTKAWRDIWGSGQGIGAIERVTTAAETIDRLARADQARYVERFGGKAAILKRGAFTHTPPPGMKATLHPVEVEGET